MRMLRSWMTLLCLAAAVMLAIWLGLEYRACATLRQQNRALQRQLSASDQALEDSQPSSNRLAQPLPATARSNSAVAAVPTAEESPQEIVRLRTELQKLRQQNQQLQTASAAGGAAQPNARASLASGPGVTADSGSQFEILQASYWTVNSNLDVSAELRERIRNDRLNAIASNNLKSDPEFGQVKHLTIIYRYAGVLRTNEFREGEFISLPAD